MMKQMVAMGIVLAVAACESGTKGTPTSTVSVAPPASPPAIDPQLAGTCVARYDCGMSHPGLGSYSDARAVDLATCTRTVTHDSGPYGHEAPQPGSAAPGKHTRSSSQLPADRCAELAKLVSAITVADAAAAQESAQIDTQACILEVTCPANGPTKLRVQRQTTSGASAVERLLRAL